MTDVLTGLDYEALVRARGTLKERADELHTGTPVDDALYRGIAYSACVAAEAAIFTALNMLGGYMRDEEALRVVHMREWEPKP